MSRPSLFQVFQLSHGPSLVYTMGAFKVGQYFRTQLIGLPHHEDNRILVEFSGNFSIFGKNLNSDVALVAGLGGFNTSETELGIRSFFEEIKKNGSFVLQSKTWPFTVESDLIFSNQKSNNPHEDTIRFHLLGPEQNILIQAEYTVSDSGFVLGPGSHEDDYRGDLENFDSFSEIIAMCKQENLSLIEYILSYERMVHSMEPEKIMTRMQQIWTIIKTSIENGLNSTSQLPGQRQRQAGKMRQILNDRFSNSETLGHEQTLANIYALAVCEESLNNQLVIATPVCETSGIVPAVLKTMQQKYHFSDDKMAKSLLIAGFVGSLLLQMDLNIYKKYIKNMHFPVATAMASAGGLFLLSSDLEILNEAIKIAVSLSDFHIPSEPEELINLNIKHSNLAIEAINLSLGGYHLSEEDLEASVLTSFKRASISSSEL